MVDFNTCRLQNPVQLQQLMFTEKETSLTASSNNWVFLHTKQQKCKYGWELPVLRVGAYALFPLLPLCLAHYMALSSALLLQQVLCPALGIDPAQ